MMPFRISLKQILLFTLLTGLLYLIYCVAISPYIPYSRCFKHDEKKIMANIEMYEKTALKSIEDYKSYIGDKGPVFADPNAKKLCLSIASVGRAKVKYLEQTVSTLLTRTPLSYQDRIQITLYNLDVPASKHTAANSLSSIIRVQHESYLSVDPEAGTINSRNVKTKEFLDYIALLTAEEKRGCDHYLVLEDDVLASKDWVKTVMDIIKQIEKQGENYSKVKLFTTAGYGQSRIWNWRNPLDIFLITATSLLLAAVIYGAMMGVSKLIKRFKSVNAEDDIKNPAENNFWGHFSRFNLISALFLLACCVSFVIFIDKRTLISPANGLSKSDTNFLCQANLYTKVTLSRWNKFFRRVYKESKMKTRPLKPKDWYASEFDDSEKLNGKKFVHMTYNPSVFQHTGIQSAIGNDRKIGSALLSYTFPDDGVAIEFDKKFIES